MSYDNLSSVSQNVLKFYQQLTGEERRVPFIFGRNTQLKLSYDIGFVYRQSKLYVSKSPSNLLISAFRHCSKHVGSLSFLVGTISNVLVMEIGWTDVGSRGYILVSCAHSNTRYSLYYYNINCVISSPITLERQK
jgi:hypothetical protein